MRGCLEEYLNKKVTNIFESESENNFITDNMIDYELENDCDVYTLYYLRDNENNYYITEIGGLEQESKIDFLTSEKENLTRTLYKCGEIISQAKEIVDWLATHNKNYTNKQYYKLLDLQEILNGD